MKTFLFLSTSLSTYTNVIDSIKNKSKPFRKTIYEIVRLRRVFLILHLNLRNWRGSKRASRARESPDRFCHMDRVLIDAPIRDRLRKHRRTYAARIL